MLTNNHVIDLVKDEGKLSVVLTDGTKLQGEIVGTNAAYDLAVVKVDTGSLPAVTLGNSDALNVGDAVVAIGAPPLKPNVAKNRKVMEPPYRLKTTKAMR